MNVTEDRKELFKAIAAAQGEFTTVEKSASNPHFKSKFAPLDSIIEMVRPILPKHGLSFMQFTDMSENGNGIIVETVIAHESGQYISGKLFMPSVKQDPQGYGSALTYGKRYGLSAALGIVSDEDIDGNQPEGAERQTRGQQKAQQPPKSAAQPANAPKEIVEPTKARIELLNELGQIFHGRADEMADALRTYSAFTGTAGEKFLTLANLEHPTENEKLHKWFGSALGKLRKDVEGKFDQHKNDKLRELKEDMRVE